jgi:hypothetical protein
MKLRAAIIGAIAAMAVFTATALSTTEAAYAGKCRPDFKRHADIRGNHWSTGWICGNRAGTGVYLGADAVRKVAILDSNPSWFVCYAHGAWHAGQNDVWYYTQGDRVVPGNASLRGWGFVPAVNVWTSIDPWPFMHRCPWRA